MVTNSSDVTSRNQKDTSPIQASMKKPSRNARISEQKKTINTSADGQPIDDLPAYPVRGLTSLTKDIETRIQEIENVGVHIWHWYYESLIGLGFLWLAWLVGLIFIGTEGYMVLDPYGMRIYMGDKRELVAEEMEQGKVNRIAAVGVC